MQYYHAHTCVRERMRDELTLVNYRAFIKKLADGAPFMKNALAHSRAAAVSVLCQSNFARVKRATRFIYPCVFLGFLPSHSLAQHHLFLIIHGKERCVNEQRESRLLSSSLPARFRSKHSDKPSITHILVYSCSERKKRERGRDDTVGMCMRESVSRTRCDVFCAR